MAATSPRVILVTGASSGIGYEVVLEFARRGDKVGATARRADRLTDLVQAAKEFPGEILPLVADVCSPDDMARAVDEIAARWGRLDVLVANAGIGHRGALVDAAWSDLEAVLRTNIDGVLHSIRAAVPLMRKSGGGHIVTISSVQSRAPSAYSAIYSASKSTLDTLARTLRQELAPDHIWVTNVLVGQTHSEFAQSRRGKPGRVARNLPTMPTEYVARRIVALSASHRREAILRPVDRLIVFAGLFFPQIMDRILARIYKT